MRSLTLSEAQARYDAQLPPSEDEDPAVYEVARCKTCGRFFRREVQEHAHQMPRDCWPCVEKRNFPS